MEGWEEKRRRGVGGGVEGGLKYPPLTNATFSPVSVCFRMHHSITAKKGEGERSRVGVGSGVGRKEGGGGGGGGGGA